MMENNQNLSGTSLENNIIEPIDNENFNNNLKQKNKKLSFLLAVVGGLLVMFIMIFIFYIITMKNPENVFANLVNGAFNQAENIITTKFNLEDSGLIEGTTKFDSNMDELNSLTRESYDYTFGYDIKNKKLELSTVINVDGKEKISAGVDVKNNNVYVIINELFDKVIQIDEDMIKEKTEMSINDIFEKIEETLSEDKSEDLLYITKEMKKITNKGIKNAKYNKKNAVIEVDGKKIKSTKMTLVLNEENKLLIVGKIIEEMLNNDKLLTKISRVVDEEKEELIKYLEAEKLELENPEDDLFYGGFDEAVYVSSFSVYTCGLFNKIIKLAIEEDGEETSSFVNYKDIITISSDSTIIKIKDKKLTVTDDGEKILDGNINSFENDNIDVIFKSSQEDIEGTFKYINNSDNVTLEFALSQNSEDNQFELEFNIGNKKLNNKEYNNKLALKVRIDNKFFKIINDATLYLGRDIATNKTNNSISIESLTDEDINNILNKLQEYNDISIISLINSVLTVSTYPDNDFENYYDEDNFYSDYDY